MATAIEVDVTDQTDIDIEWGSVSITTEVDHQTDIEFSVLRGSNITMLAREIVQEYITFGAIGTYQKTWNPSAGLQAGPVTSLGYIIATITVPAKSSHTAVPSIPGSDITLTLGVSNNSGGFPYNYTAGCTRIWYYLGPVPSGNLTLQVQNDTATMADGARAHFYAGTVFGTVALLGTYDLATGSSGGTIRPAYDSGSLTGLPFLCYTSAAGAGDAVIGNVTRSDDGVWASNGNSYYWSSGMSYRPTYLGNDLKGAWDGGTVFFSGSACSLALTDSLDASEASGTGVIDVEIEVDHDIDLEVVVKGTRPR